MRNISAVGGALLLVLLVGCGKESEQSSLQDSHPETAIDATQDVPTADTTASQDVNTQGDASTIEEPMSSEDEDRIDAGQTVVVDTD